MTFKKGDVVALISGDKFRDGVDTRKVSYVATSETPEKDLVYFEGYDKSTFMYSFRLKVVKEAQPFKVGDVVKRKDGEPFIDGYMTSVVKSIREGEKVYFEGRDTYLYTELLELASTPPKTIREKLLQINLELEKTKEERDELHKQLQEKLDKIDSLAEKKHKLKQAQEVMEEES